MVAGSIDVYSVMGPIFMSSVLLLSFSIYSTAAASNLLSLAM